ncbi:MAG: SpoIIE family protein phosphatase [Chloroflexota bacterium]|nr:SpoIIE family protein phosphatase [Chloroflexota bacterium]
MSDYDPAELPLAARDALQHRRYPPSLLNHLDALEPAALRADPWVALLQGRRLCRLHSKFAESTPLIDAAVAEFQARGDHEGELWAMAEWIVMRYHAEEFDRGLEGILPLLDSATQPYLRAELHFGVFLCLVGQSRIQEAVVASETALAALDQETDPWLQRLGRIQMLRNIAAGYHYTGEMQRSVDAALQAASLAQAHDDTAYTRPWCFYELGLAFWRQGRLDAAADVLDTSRRLAETWDHRELWRWAVAAQGHVLRDQDRLDAALAAYQLAGCWAEDPEGPAFIQLRQGRLAEARWSCEVCLALAKEGRGRMRVAEAQLLLALVELASGKPGEALALLERADALYAASGFEYHAATAQLYRAAAALALGQSPIVADGVGRYLRFAARENVLTCAWWTPELIGPLLLYALQHGIETAWAQRLLEHRFSAAGPSWYASGSPHQNAELEIARRVQLSLLPELPPVMPDLDIAARVLPAVEVGGDFVAYYPRGAVPEVGVQRQLGIAVGDISGKGLGAALLLSGTVVALNTVAANGAPPAQVAEALHLAMQPYTSRSQMNIALCYTLLVQQHDGWLLRTIGAGAVPPLLLRASGEVAWLDTIGFPLGALVTQHYSEVHSRLAPGDVVLLLSDGIIEAMSAERQLFGFDRLAATLAAIGPDRNAHGILTAILEAVGRHSAATEQHDDITLVVVRVLAGGTA